MAAVARATGNNGHIDKLNKILAEGRLDPKVASVMEKVIGAARETIGISADNFLAWNDRFLSPYGYIDGISMKDIGNKKLVWGYDPSNRPFVAFQYVTTTGTAGEKASVKESSTLFQRFDGNENGNVVVGCGGGKFDGQVHSSQLKELQTLFSGQTVTRKDWDEKVTEISMTAPSDGVPMANNFFFRIKGDTVEDTKKSAQKHISQAGMTVFDVKV